MQTQNETYTAFSATAAQFCALVESSEKLESIVLRILIADLYSAGVRLPELQEAKYAHVRTPELREQRRILQRRLAMRLPFENYWVVFQPRELTAKSVLGSLSDDLADIWYDLKPGLDALKHLPVEDHPDVWWNWRFNFETHWGVHAVQALAALHGLHGNL